MYAIRSYYVSDISDDPNDTTDYDSDGDGDPDDITIVDIIPDSIIIPEGFSPNGDGQNEYFIIDGIEYYSNNSIIIMNRWGNKVFESAPYNNDWDGTKEFGVSVGGGALPEGTYFYILDLGNGQPVIKGYVYLKK